MGAILEFKDDQYEDLLEYINKMLSYGKKIKESVEECERYNRKHKRDYDDEYYEEDKLHKKSGRYSSY
jgi:hypothetical protein